MKWPAHLDRKASDSTALLIISLGLTLVLTLVLLAVRTIPWAVTLRAGAPVGEPVPDGVEQQEGIHMF